jgi:tetratricopeptide (TPR) repeat protein
MTHDAVIDRLSEYLDGEDMSTAERAAVDTHLAVCAECRTTLDELRAVASFARQLPDSGPSTELWPGVMDRIETTSRVVSFARTPQRRFTFTLPQLVAASLALMVLSGGMVWIARSGNPSASLPSVVALIAPTTNDSDTPAFAPATFADTYYDQAVADLEKTLADGRNRLDPETVRIIEENLLSMDQAIEQSKKALRADPANVYLNNHFAAYRNRKLALLRRATALAAHDNSGS